jgi:hypothetical protein
MQQRDYIERLIQQIAAFIARIVGAAKSGDAQEAEATLDAAWGALGLLRRDALRLDDATLKMLLGAKTALAADLFEAQASLEEARDQSATADTLRRRATALRGAG